MWYFLIISMACPIFNWSNLGISSLENISSLDDKFTVLRSINELLLVRGVCILLYGVLLRVLWRVLHIVSVNWNVLWISGRYPSINVKCLALHSVVALCCSLLIASRPLLINGHHAIVLNLLLLLLLNAVDASIRLHLLVTSSLKAVVQPIDENNKS